MKGETLHISNFGPIESAKIAPIKPVTVFIGESGSGKSTVMKVLAMCRWLFKMHCIRSYLKLSGIKSSPFRLSGDRILNTNGLSAFVRPDSAVEYHNGSFSCMLKGRSLSMTKDILPADELSLEKIAYVSDKRGLLPDLITGRIAIKHGMFHLDDTLGNFQKALDAVSATDMPYLGVRAEVRKTNAGRRVFISQSGEEGFEGLPLSQASSGLQSSVGIHFILQYFARHYNVVESMNSTILSYLAKTDNLSGFKPTSDVGAFGRRRITLFIEEPELSLFPSNQKGFVDYMLSTVHSACRTSIALVMATHSPYVLTTLNLMLAAAKARRVNPEMAADAAPGIPEVAQDDIGAWEIRDGRATALIDAETGLIDGTWLDNVSDYFDDTIFKLNSIIYG